MDTTLCLLVAALAGDTDAVAALTDCVKEAGTEEAGVKLEELFDNVKIIKDVRRALWFNEHGWCRNAEWSADTFTDIAAALTGFEPTDEEIDKSRRKNADQAFAEYDFEDEVVKDTGPWTANGDQWERTVFFENGDEPSTKATFVVSFDEESAAVLDAYEQDAASPR